MATSDDVFFDHAGGIRITRTVALFYGVSYPVANIGSVRIDRKSISGAFFGAAFITIVAGLIFGEIIFFACVIASGFAIWAIDKTKSMHTLILRTSSGDQQVVSSRDHNFLTSIKTALDAAISARG